VSAVAAVLFLYLWVQMMINADDPLTLRIRLDMAIWIAVVGTPWMVAARLLWRAWWRRAGAELSRMDGPAWLLAAAAATLPADRREWGAAMAAELTQVENRAARRRAGLAGAAGGHRADAGRRRRLCRVHHLVRGRVPLDPIGSPARHLGHAHAGDGGRPCRGAGRWPVAGRGPTALAGR
jgi:hypothetical protein